MKRWPVAGVAVAVIGFVGALVWFALGVPDRVPVHFNVAGEADRWTSKSSFLAVMGGTGGVMVAIFATSRWWISKVPASKINLPGSRTHAYWTAAQRRGELNHMVSTSLEMIGSACALLFTTLVIVSGLVARGTHLPGWVFAAILGMFLAATAASLTYLLRQTRVPPQHRAGD